jgi:hypothetical protein
VQGLLRVRDANDAFGSDAELKGDDALRETRVGRATAAGFLGAQREPDEGRVSWTGPVDSPAPDPPTRPILESTASPPKPRPPNSGALVLGSVLTGKRKPRRTRHRGQDQEKELGIRRWLNQEPAPTRVAQPSPCGCNVTKQRAREALNSITHRLAFTFLYPKQLIEWCRRAFFGLIVAGSHVSPISETTSGWMPH